MKNKKTLLLPAILLLLSVVVPVSAASKPSTEITGTYKAPEINVVIPSSAEVFINPYRLPVTIGEEETDAQIVSSPACIENQSLVPISISISVTGAVKEGSNMRLVATSTQGTKLTSKSAFLYFEMQAADSEDPNAVYWDDEFDPARHLVIRTTQKAMKNVVALGAGGEAGCFGAFRLSGDCVAHPKIAWTEDDGIDVTISFTFSPLRSVD